MKKSLLIALFAAMPLVAQECPQKPCCAPQKPCGMKMQRPQLTEEQKAEMKAKFMEKFDADKDGQISDAEKEAIKAEMKAKFMEKFDADKDGQLSDAEKEAAKAEFQKRGPKFGKRGHRRPGCCGKRGPKGQRPQLTEEQKAEMKAKFEARKAEMKAKFMEKFDADKDGQLSDAEKEAAKAEFQKRGPKGPKCGKRGHRRPGCCGKRGPKGQRPQLTEEQKAEMKAKFEARKAKFMEKFDADKDGQLSDAEKEAAKAEFQKRAPKCGKKGHRRPCCAPKCEKN